MIFIISLFLQQLFQLCFVDCQKNPKHMRNVVKIIWRLKNLKEQNLCYLFKTFYPHIFLFIIECRFILYLYYDYCCL